MKMIVRHKNNPIIKPRDVKPTRDGYKVLGAFNPGAVNFGDEIILLVRVAEGCEPREGYVRTPVCRFEDDGDGTGDGTAVPDILEFKASDPAVTLKDTRAVAYKGREFLSTLSHIRVARSRDGVNFTVEDEPFIYPACEAERYGVEDARVTFIDGKYYINYTAVSEDSWATALAVTEDFKNLERKGLIFCPENKDVAIFPEKVGGKYVALHRPNNSGFGKPAIWYAESPDLLHWGNHKCVLRTRDRKSKRKEENWESERVGAGAPPIKTSEGWLVICHGKGADDAYSLFCLLLDLEEPFRVLRRASVPLLTPTEPYETEGFFGNVVFSNGVVEREQERERERERKQDGDGKVFLYYGASDESVCVAVTDVESLLGSF